MIFLDRDDYQGPPVNLPREVQDALASSPEWAMDVQLVDFRLRDGSEIQSWVVGGRHAQTERAEDIVGVIRVHTR